jgi:hypothetical protein
MKDENTYYRGRLVLKCPENFAELVKATARRQMTSQSEYIRRSILAQLAQDGVCVTETKAA